MKLPARTIYGLQALMQIALHSGKEGISIREIARNQEIPSRFLEQIMSILKKNKLVRSIRGRSGGYILNKKPTDLTFWEALEVLEGQISLNGGKGTIKQVLMAVEDRLISELKKITFADLIKDQIKKDNVPYYVI